MWAAPAHTRSASVNATGCGQALGTADELSALGRPTKAPVAAWRYTSPTTPRVPCVAYASSIGRCQQKVVASKWAVVACTAMPTSRWSHALTRVTASWPVGIASWGTVRTSIISLHDAHRLRRETSPHAPLAPQTRGAASVAHTGPETRRTTWPAPPCAWHVGTRGTPADHGSRVSMAARGQVSLWSVRDPSMPWPPSACVRHWLPCLSRCTASGVCGVVRAPCVPPDHRGGAACFLVTCPGVHGRPYAVSPVSVLCQNTAVASHGLSSNTVRLPSNQWC